MQTQNRLLDDLARLASGAMGVANEMRGEVESRMRRQFERLLDQMDLVTREEFDAVKAMAAKAREEQEILAERLAALEVRLAMAAPEVSAKSESKARASSGAAAKKSPAAKPAAKRAAKPKSKAAAPKAPGDDTTGA